MISSLARFTFCPCNKNWICSTHPCKKQDNLWPELSSPAFPPQSNSFPTHLAYSLKSLPSTKLTWWSHKMTALPTERLSDPISVGLPGCPPAHCTCWERHYCSGMLRQEGGVTPEGLVDGVKAPPGLSALSLTGCLAWPGQLGLAQTVLSFHPALGLRLLIKPPFDRLEFLNRSPFDSLLALLLFFPLCSEQRIGFLLSVMDCLVNWV